MITLVDDTVQAVRRICSDLHPRILDDLGLLPALEWQIERFRERTGLACSFHYDIENVGASRESAIAIFRVVQEALTNIARHAQASRVQSTRDPRAGSRYALPMR